MAEAVVSSVVEALISNLTSGAIQQFRGYMDVEEELGRLQQAVSRIQPLLLDAEERYTQSYEVKIWLAKLKDAFDDADDLVDDFSTEALRRELVHLGRSLKQVRIFLSKLAYGSKRLPKFKAVNKRIEKIASEGDRFQFNNRRPEMKERRETLSSPSSREVEIIGREKEKSAIVDDLVKMDNISDKANVSVISIVGSAGVGKTALAQFAYHHETVRKHFELRLL